MPSTPAELLADLKGPYPTLEEALTAAEVRDSSLIPFAKEDDSDYRAGFIKALRGGFLEEIKALCQALKVPWGVFPRVAMSLARMIKGETHSPYGWSHSALPHPHLILTS